MTIHTVYRITVSSPITGTQGVRLSTFRQWASLTDAEEDYAALVRRIEIGHAGDVTGVFLERVVELRRHFAKPRTALDALDKP